MNVAQEKQNKLFHIHIPKTAGTSFNKGLADAFGEDFQEHSLTREAPVPTARVAAAHRTYAQAIRWDAGYEFVMILRDPTKRLRSHMAHIYARAELNDYRARGNVVRELVESGFTSGFEKLQRDEMLPEFDNLLVRYLSPESISGNVDVDDLRAALENRKNVKFLYLVETLERRMAEMYDWMGVEAPKLTRRNEAIVKKPIFNMLPPELERYVMYDRIVYELQKQQA